jgi:hypothetical protein
MSRECKSQSAIFLMGRPVAGVGGADWSRVANDHAALVGGRFRRVIRFCFGPTTPTRPPGSPLALWRRSRLSCCRTSFASEQMSPSARERVPPAKTARSRGEWKGVTRERNGARNVTPYSCPTAPRPHRRARDQRRVIPHRRQARSHGAVCPSMASRITGQSARCSSCPVPSSVSRTALGSSASSASPWA